MSDDERFVTASSEYWEFVDAEEEEGSTGKNNPVPATIPPKATTTTSSSSPKTSSRLEWIRKRIALRKKTLVDNQVDEPKNCTITSPYGPSTSGLRENRLPRGRGETIKPSTHVSIQPGMCWRCGQQGHLRNFCTGTKRLFCSKCGLLGTMSRHCKCSRTVRNVATQCEILPTPPCLRPKILDLRLRPVTKEVRDTMIQRNVPVKRARRN